MASLVLPLTHSFSTVKNFNIYKRIVQDLFAMPDLDKAESYRTWADLRDMLNDLVRTSPTGFMSPLNSLYCPISFLASLYFFQFSPISCLPVALYCLYYPIFFTLPYISLCFLQFPLYPASQWPYIAHIAPIFLTLPYISICFHQCVLYALHFQKFNQINRLNPKVTSEIQWLPWACWPPNPGPLLQSPGVFHLFFIFLNAHLIGLHVKYLFTFHINP